LERFGGGDFSNMEKDLKILMISSDKKLLEEGSTVSERIKEYGNLVEEIHVVLLCNKSHTESLKISSNVWVYPTNSVTSVLRPIDAARIGKRIVLEKKFVRGQSVITCQDLESGWAGVRVKNKWRIPLEIQMHTDPFSPYFTGFQNTVRKFFMKRILNNADSIRVVNESLKEKLKIVNSKLEIYTLPIYVDKEKIENATIAFDLHARYPWHFILLSVSRLESEKNLGLALRTLALVRQSFPETGLIIVGSGSEEGKLKSLVQSLGLQGAVAFAGWQDNLSSFYKTANAYLQTSLFEGYGLSLVEAGLSGLPVITTPVGLALELEHGKNAYIFPHDRPDLFASGIIDLIENNQKRENLKFNLKKTLEIKLISKDQYLNQLLENWKEIAGRVA